MNISQYEKQTIHYCMIIYAYILLLCEITFSVDTNDGLRQSGNGDDSSHQQLSANGIAKQCIVLYCGLIYSAGTGGWSGGGWWGALLTQIYHGSVYGLVYGVILISDIDWF